MTQFHSQSGEDAILAEIFAGQDRGTCLEVGVLDGIRDSVTLYFEEGGWNCILIEANPELAAQAQESRRARVFACAAGKHSGTTEFILARGADYLSTTKPTEAHISRIIQDGATVEKMTVPVIRVDDALEESGVSRLDFASIDVEGAELDVLRGFDLERWQPRVLLIEENDPEVRSYLWGKNYRCFLHEGWNDWYALKHDKALLTWSRRIIEWRRLARKRLFATTIGLLPYSMQQSIIRSKRRWIGGI